MQNDDEDTVADSVVWAGLGAFYSFTFDPDYDDPAQLVKEIFVAMRSREIAENAGRSDLKPQPAESPFRSLF